MTRCPVCHGPMVEKNIRHMHEWKDTLVVFENVPADVCEACGEQLLKGEVVDRMNQILWSMEPPHRHLRVPLYDLATA